MASTGFAVVGRAPAIPSENQAHESHLSVSRSTRRTIDFESVGNLDGLRSVDGEDAHHVEEIFEAHRAIWLRREDLDDTLRKWILLNIKAIRKDTPLCRSGGLTCSSLIRAACFFDRRQSWTD